VVVFAVAAAAGLAAVLWRAGVDERSTAFLFGAGVRGPAAVLPTGAEVCQTPIELQADSDAVSFPVGTDRRAGSPLTVTVRDLHGHVLARHAVRGGYADGAVQTAAFPRVREGRSISVCIRNDGPRTAYPLGEDAVVDSGTVQGGHRSTIDVALGFLRRHPRSVLSQVPSMFRRAALFRFDWLGAWTIWALAIAVVLGVPTLCACALARAASEDELTERREDRPRRPAGA
jgi:hypothetical protein